MADSRLKVLFIGPYPPPYSGPEMGMKLFLDSRLRDELNIRFLCTNVRRTNTNKGRLGLAMLAGFVRFFALLSWQLIVFRPRVVYYPVTATKVGWIGRDFLCILLSRFAAAAVVIHLRASHFRLNYETFAAPVRWLVRLALGRVSVAVVQSDMLHDQFRGLIPDERIRTLYQAIDASEYENRSPREYRPGRILFLGHLTKAKGYCDLVQAIGPVVAEFSEAQFVFAGTMRSGERNVFFNQFDGSPLTYQDPFAVEKDVLAGPYREHYRNLGVVSGDDKLRELRDADLFVLPSYSEGFSRAIVEAMSMGKPIVYTPVGAHAEALDPSMGACVVPGDVRALSDAICGLLRDRESRDRTAIRNAETVRERFDIDIIAGRLGELLHEAAGNPTRRINGRPKEQSCGS